MVCHFQFPLALRYDAHCEPYYTGFTIAAIGLLPFRLLTSILSARGLAQYVLTLFFRLSVAFQTGRIRGLRSRR